MSISKEKRLSVQLVLQNYMLERFLEMVSLSWHRSQFIIKGGFLIASIVNLDTWSTMDIDATIKQHRFGWNYYLMRSISLACTMYFMYFEYPCCFQLLQAALLKRRQDTDQNTSVPRPPGIAFLLDPLYNAVWLKASHKPDTPRRSKKGETSAMKRTLSMLLVLCLCGSLFCFPAQAEETAEQAAAGVVDIVTMPLNTKGVAALMADGTVRTAGLDAYFDTEAVAEIGSWTDLVQLDATMYGFLGLKADGSVVSTVQYERMEDAFDPKYWTNVKEILANEYGYFGLTKDGRVLVHNDDEDASFGGCKVYQSWTKVQKLCYYAYPEARGLCGLRSDGSALRPSEFYPFHGKASKLVDIDSSGYICCGLRSDGTLCVSGPSVEYFGNFDEISAARDVVQISVNERAIACRLKDGRVTLYGGAEELRNAVAVWEDVEDVQALNCMVLGLMRNGRVRAARWFETDQAKQMQAEVESWTDIVRIKAYEDSFVSYIVGWKNDGSLVTAGLDLSGLDLSTPAFSGYADALLLQTLSSGEEAPAVIALRNDGTLDCTGLTQELTAQIGAWKDIVQIRATQNAVYGLRADGIVEAVAINTDSWFADEIRAEMEQAMAWRNITSLASTGMRPVGLKADGSIAVGGPTHFGTEEKADWSGWTGVSYIQGGLSLGGEYLLGIKAHGVVTKGSALSTEAYGTPRNVVQAACSGYQVLFLEKDGKVSSLGFAGVKSWSKIRSVCALDGLALGLREDGTVAIDLLEGFYPKEAAQQIKSWTRIRTLCTAADGLVVGVTEEGKSLVAESKELTEAYGEDCLAAVKSWTNLDRILGVSFDHRVLAIKSDGSLIAYGLTLPQNA